MSKLEVSVIGGGLAGCEAAWRLWRHGVSVTMWEMKPGRFSPAHVSPGLAELVCSNSFRSADRHSAVGLLKEEMRRLGSLIMEAAQETQVPAGKALAVDREKFSAFITSRLEGLDGVRIVREEVKSLAIDHPTVMATGPLTSEELARSLAELIGAEHLYFYDAIAPIVTAESIDMSRAFVGSRYGPAEEGDYLNCPMSESEYATFYEALMQAEKTPVRDFEQPQFFEGCLPIEVMAERGPRTLCFGPLKPVGLVDPATGRRPHAVVQLRREDQWGTHYNLVGFQTRLKQSEQARVFRLIPGLGQAEFARFGSVHRNTFIQGPAHLNAFLQMKQYPLVFLAGQITGVEGYVESSATGILAGENLARLVLGRPMIAPPPTTALGGLLTHLTTQPPRKFQPSNVNFGSLPPAPSTIRKSERPAYLSDRALSDLEAWKKEVAFVL